jgi:hypothetical protein
MTPRKKLSLIAISTLPLLALLSFTGHGQNSIFLFHLGMLLVTSGLSFCQSAPDRDPLSAPNRGSDAISLTHGLT